MVDTNGDLGYSTNLFETPIYSNKIGNDIKFKQWENIYIYFNYKNKQVIVYNENSKLLSFEFLGETYPPNDIILGTSWVSGGGDYSAPIKVYYDDIEIGNKAILPKLSFIDFIINLLIKYWQWIISCLLFVFICYIYKNYKKIKSMDYKP